MDLIAKKFPSRELAFQNSCFVHPDVYQKLGSPRILLKNKVLQVQEYNLCIPQTLCFDNTQRAWLEIGLDEIVKVEAYQGSLEPIIYLKIKIKLLGRPEKHSIKADNFNLKLHQALDLTAINQSQLILWRFAERIYQLEIIGLEGINGPIECGQLLDLSEITCETDQPNLIEFTDQPKKLIDLDFDLTKLGIGGLDHEFDTIFRRAFVSRIFPSDFIQSLGLNHVRGIILYGPPGTGKTLVARQIGKLLNTVEPKIVNGPEILNKYVGQSEENLRNLFKDAEKDSSSNLHLIIFDEIDAICKSRGSSSNSQVADSLVNQLLSKMDGVKALENVLVIGMTNRLDLLDPALLRPGRFEIQLEFTLPDLTGREQILKIHTEKLKPYMDPSIDLSLLAAQTENFTGAELSGLVRSASSYAFKDLVDLNKLDEATDLAIDTTKILIKNLHFNLALEHDIKPKFSDPIAKVDFIYYSRRIQKEIESGLDLIEKLVGSNRFNIDSLAIKTRKDLGSTTFALELQSRFSSKSSVSTWHIDPSRFLGLNEDERSRKLMKIFKEAQMTKTSIIILDRIEKIITFNPIGPRFYNNLLQLIQTLVQTEPKNKCFVIGIMDETMDQYLDLGQCFNHHLVSRPIKKIEHLETICENLEIELVSEIEELLDGNKGVPIKKLMRDLEV